MTGGQKSSLLIGTYPFPIVVFPGVKALSMLLAGWRGRYTILDIHSFCYCSLRVLAASTPPYSVLYCLIMEMFEPRDGEMESCTYPQMT